MSADAHGARLREPTRRAHLVCLPAGVTPDGRTRPAPTTVAAAGPLPGAADRLGLAVVPRRGLEDEDLERARRAEHDLAVVCQDLSASDLLGRRDRHVA